MGARFLAGFDSYEEARSSFRWTLPAILNIAETVTRHAAERPSDPALIVSGTGGERRFSFQEVDALSGRFGRVLRECGIQPGDRVATILPQSCAALVAQLGILKAAGVMLPLTPLFGPDAIEYRLRDSGARALVADRDAGPVVARLRPRLPSLRTVFTSDGGEPHAYEGSFWEAIHRAGDPLPPAATAPDDPCFLLYTSGSTGDPKGVLHAHRFFWPHLVAFEMFNNFEVGPGSVFWTPADWAWIGALFDLVYPALYFGRPVIAYRAPKFSPEEAFRLVEKYRVTNVFLPPTALRMMRTASEAPGKTFRLRLKVIFSGGEAVTPEIFDWVNRQLCPLNELYGQTEANLLVSNCTRWFAPVCGSMGRAVPGHTVEVLDERGRVAPAGEIGQIALRRPDPVLFLEYLNKPDKTASAFFDDWLLTGDTGRKDDKGHFWFHGRNDDVIITAGYRLGPTEVERALLAHPAVTECAVIGIPDPLRGSVVKAYVRAAQGEGADRGRLAAELQQLVRERVGGFAYPREVEFVDRLPMTTTGKIRRGELRRRAREGASAPGTSPVLGERRGGCRSLENGT